MRVKPLPLIVEMMNRDFPEFRFTDSPFYYAVFRRKSQRDLFDYIEYQRDSKAGALAVYIATTYNPNWNLHPTGPTGLSYPLVIYKKTGRIEGGGIGLSYRSEEPWYIYGNYKIELQNVLAAISRDLTNFSFKFFREAARILESDKLLQYGLNLIRERGSLSDNELAALQKEIEAVRDRPWDIRNEYLNYLKQNLRSYATQINASREQRRLISGLAMALIFLQPDKQV